MAIDTSATARRRLTGWERFVSDLVDALRRLPAEDLTPAEIRPRGDSRGKVSHFARQLAWYGFGLRRRTEGAVDVLHAPAFPPPHLRVPTVWTVHDDLILGGHARFARPGARVWVPLARRALRHVAAVVATTTSVASDLRAVGVDAGRIHVVRPGVPALPPSSDDPPVVVRRDGRPQPPPDAFLLVVGTLEPRKRPDVAVRAAARLGAPVVFAGRRDAGLAADDLPAWSHVYFTGHLADRELAWLYRHAGALVAASAYEGFDFPVSEALSVGLAVAASDIPVHREVGGRWCELFPEGDDEAAADAIAAALEKRQPAVALPTWDVTARGYLDVYRSVAAGPRSRT